MYGFIVHDEANENGSMHLRVLRTLLTQNLENLMPALHDAMENSLLKEMNEASLNSNGLIFFSILVSSIEFVAETNSS